MSNIIDFADGDFLVTGTTLDDLFVSQIVIIIMLGVIAVVLLQFGFYGIIMGFGLSSVCWLLGLIYTLCYAAITKHTN